MTEYDYWKLFPRMPKKVTIGDITVRDGFQHLEKFVSTRANILPGRVDFCRVSQHRSHQFGESVFDATVQ